MGRIMSKLMLIDARPTNEVQHPSVKSICITITISHICSVQDRCWVAGSAEDAVSAAPFCQLMLILLRILPCFKNANKPHTSGQEVLLLAVTPLLAGRGV